MSTQPEENADDDESPGISPGRRAFRLGQVAVYAALSVAIPAYMYMGGKMMGTMVVFTWLMAFYMAARALAIYVKFRQETRPPRYSRAYVEARDLFQAQPSPSTEDKKNDPTQNGSSHG